MGNLRSGVFFFLERRREKGEGEKNTSPRLNIGREGMIAGYSMGD